jgi:hypothetical protein
MSPETSFWFYLAAIICWVLAAAGSAWRFGRLGRAGLEPRLVLVPLGLALFLFPTLWTTGKLAF